MYVSKVKKDGAAEYFKECEQYRLEIQMKNSEKESRLSFYEKLLEEASEKESAMRRVQRDMDKLVNKYDKERTWLEIAHPHRDLNWYYNVSNVPNQSQLFILIEFLEKNIPEKVFEKSEYWGGDFKNLTPCYVHFLNVIFRQVDEMQYRYLERPINFIKHLRDLPLSDREIYLLLGVILFWHGGYPVNSTGNQHYTILKLIEKEFLGMYADKALPEKDFCKNEQLKDLNIIAEHLNNTSISNIIEDVSPTLDSTSKNERLNKAHLVRGLFEMVTTMGANHDRTTVAKLAFFLINGKETTSKKEYQTLLNAISAENKQPNNKTAKAEKETIKSYLKTLNLLKEE